MEDYYPIKNKQVVEELLWMVRGGLSLPKGLIGFVVNEDLTDLPCRSPALLAVDCMIAQIETLELFIRLGVRCARTTALF